jgi:3-oxoadipate enol-lactonase
MPNVKANGISLYYEQQGSGDPLVLIPYLSADNACYAFQVAEYAKHYTCITLDLRGTGQSDKPETPYTSETLADDVAGLLTALNIPKAHFMGLSLGAAVSLWMAAKYPDKTRSASVHSGWDKSDGFMRAVLEGWRHTTKANGVQEMVQKALFPWCFTAELYNTKPEFIQGLKDFVKSRPEMTIPNFMLQSDAVINHDVSAHLHKIKAPLLLSVGRFDQLTSTRFTDRIKSTVKHAEVQVYEGCSHAMIYEQVEEFNAKSLAFLKRH